MGRMKISKHEVLDIMADADVQGVSVVCYNHFCIGILLPLPCMHDGGAKESYEVYERKESYLMLYMLLFIDCSGKIEFH
jgi:hypothetical protein